MTTPPDARHLMVAERRVALLVEDPDLALGVMPDQRAMAERVVLVPVLEAVPGPVLLDAGPTEPTLGAVVLSGFLTATTTFATQSTSQLLGPGHILHTGLVDDGLLPVTCTHEALTSVRLAILDRRFIAAVRRWPELLLAVHERLRRQQRQLAIHAAVGRLRRNEDRVLAVLWQVAEQWGHVTAEGVTLPVRFTHAALGRVAGASRPTTSLALATLEAEGRLRRTSTNQLLLDPDASMILRRATEQTPRRSGRAAVTPTGRSQRERAELLERVAALRSGFDDRVRNVDDILSASRASAARNAETRRQLQSGRAGRPPSP